MKKLIVERIAGQAVASISGFVGGQIAAKMLRTQNQYAVVSELIVLYDGQGFECFTKADTVGDDAPANSFELVDRPDHAITLEPVEFFPDNCVADPRGGFDDPIFIKLVAQVFEKLV